MKPDLSWLVGNSVVSVTHDSEHTWFFCFSDSSSLRVECCWQIVADGRVALADGDHNQQYGLPSAIDAEARANEYLSGRVIEGMSVDSASADLKIHLSDSVELRTFNDSSGYEAWQLASPQGMEFIAQGGGTIVTISRKNRA